MKKKGMEKSRTIIRGGGVPLFVKTFSREKTKKGSYTRKKKNSQIKKKRRGVLKERKGEKALLSFQGRKTAHEGQAPTKKKKQREVTGKKTFLNSISSLGGAISQIGRDKENTGRVRNTGGEERWMSFFFSKGKEGRTRSF